MSNTGFHTVYFQKPGPQNTDKTLDLACEHAVRLGIQSIVVASTTGSTGVKASKVFQKHRLVIVSHVTGFKEPNAQSLLAENRELIEKNGARVVTAAHAFGSIGRAAHRRFGAIQLDELIANVLRMFGQGTKVACEIACMAVDAGLIRSGELMVSIGGTHKGADTAITMKPSNTHTFFETRIHEFICKPHLKEASP